MIDANGASPDPLSRLAGEKDGVEDMASPRAQAAPSSWKTEGSGIEGNRLLQDGLGGKPQNQPRRASQNALDRRQIGSTAGARFADQFSGLKPSVPMMTVCTWCKCEIPLYGVPQHKELEFTAEGTWEAAKYDRVGRLSTISMDASNDGLGLVARWTKQAKEKITSLTWKDDFKPKLKTMVTAHNVGDRMRCPYEKILSKKQKVALATGITSLVAGAGLCGWQLCEVENGGSMLPPVFIAAICLGALAVICLLLFVKFSNEGKAIKYGVTAVGISVLFATFGTYTAISNTIEADKIVTVDIVAYVALGAAGLSFFIGVVCLALYLRTEAGWAKGRTMATVIGVFGGTTVAALTGIILKDSFHDAINTKVEPEGSPLWLVIVFGAVSVLSVVSIWIMITGGQATGWVQKLGLILLILSAASLTAGVHTAGLYAINFQEAAVEAGADKIDTVTMSEFLFHPMGYAILIGGGLLLIGLIITFSAKCLQSPLVNQVARVDNDARY